MCPFKGFKDGMISMVDSQPPSGLSGVLPDGTFDTNLVLQFCCRNDGFTRNPLLLPNKEPFILYKNHNTCQKVEGGVWKNNCFIRMKILEWFYELLDYMLNLIIVWKKSSFGY